MLVACIFSFFPTLFSTLPERHLLCWVTCTFSSANSFNLDETKMFFSCKDWVFICWSILHHFKHYFRFLFMSVWQLITVFSVFHQHKAGALQCLAKDIPSLKPWLIDSMVFNAIFNIISVISWPVPPCFLFALMLRYSFKPLAAFPHSHCQNNGQRWERNWPSRVWTSICSQVTYTDWATGCRRPWNTSCFCRQKLFSDSVIKIRLL